MLINNDCLVALDELEENSVDSIVTDPPYELNFMGKGWDSAGVSFNKETWAKCLRVLKPGGYLLAFGGSRTYHRIACAIEDAGFEIRDCIMWLYGSGFPKSMDISKKIDKKGGDDYSEQFAKDLKQARESRGLTQKYCDDKYCGGTTNWSWYEGRPSGMRVPDYKTYLKIVRDFSELEKYGSLIKEADREVIGKQKTNLTVYQKIGDSNESGEIEITIPKTDLARRWSGWGTALKPSYEPIIVARKPFIGSCVDNVIKWGVGGLNIDECRVGDEVVSIHNAPAGSFAGGEYGRGSDTESYRNSVGRFPANTIFDSQDSEEWRRYFYCAKASKKDRDEGLEEFEEDTTDDGRKKPIDNPYLRGGTMRRNTHPTVKPTTLMQYLVRLVTPRGGTVLDPFMGSGSTGKAVAYENKERNAGYKFIGIEKDAEYCKIAEARIKYVEQKEQQQRLV